MADSACPGCGSVDRLTTQEQATVLYPVRFPAGWQRADGEAAPYTGARVGRTLDETAQWDGELCCGECDWSGHWSLLRHPMTRPAAQRLGQPAHAFPRELVDETTCTNCGGGVHYAGWDEPADFRDAVDLWWHDAGDYFCPRVTS